MKYLLLHSCQQYEQQQQCPSAFPQYVHHAGISIVYYSRLQQTRRSAAGGRKLSLRLLTHKKEETKIFKIVTRFHGLLVI